MDHVRRRFFHHRVSAGTSSSDWSALLWINVVHNKVLYRGGLEDITKLTEINIPVNFDEIKQFSSNTTPRVRRIQKGLRIVRMRVPSIRDSYTEHFSSCLTRIRVPEVEHEAIIESIFRAVDIASTPDLPINVAVWDITEVPPDFPRPRGAASLTAIQALEQLQLTEADGEQVVIKTPSLSSIQALEQLQLTQAQVEQAILQTPSCPICFNDFDLSPKDGITRLPCSHHYHLHCILQWLQKSHVCPMCRYPLPTDEHAQHPN
ncbi:RING-type E3 ubiquitin transferase [Ranunculus cassubicifolius]